MTEKIGITENGICKQYKDDCEKLWVRYSRSAGIPPTAAYAKDKKELEDQLAIDLAPFREIP